ncbi:MAG TPA: hypothetical protein VN843_13010 [Anaerolineales bacterium]|nr:hypothetical protein [Anaerolineales bacterium]
MNLYQRMILGVAAVVIAVMTIFPPWVFVLQRPELPRVERFAGYYPIWQSNTPTDQDALTRLFQVAARPSFVSIRIDTTRLGIQIVAVLLVTLLLVVLLKSRNAEPEKT